VENIIQSECQQLFVCKLHQPVDISAACDNFLARFTWPDASTLALHCFLQTQQITNGYNSPDSTNSDINGSPS